MHFRGKIAAAAPPKQWTDKKGVGHAMQQFMLQSDDGDKLAVTVFKDIQMQFLGAHLGGTVNVALEIETYWHKEKAQWYNNVRCTGIEYEGKDIEQEQEPEPQEQDVMPMFAPQDGNAMGMPNEWFGNATATRRRPGRPRLAKRG